MHIAIMNRHTKYYIMKKICLSLALLASASTAYAGGYLTNTNQHVSFLRNPARNASTSIDALYSNPAGIAFMPEGWHFSLNLQSAYQNRDIKATFAPFALNGDGQSATGTRLFKGRAEAPLIPSFFVAYKKERWTFGTHVAVVGGGGRAVFSSGLPSFEAPISLVPTTLKRLGIQSSQYMYDSQLSGSQYIFGATLGAAYRINESLSAYVGLRLNVASNRYEGYIRNIRADVNGRMTPLAALLPAPYNAFVADREIAVSQSGLGLSPILGVNYKLGDLHLAAKYEFKSSITLKNKTTQDAGMAAYKDGLESSQDIPALLSLGASYSINPDLRVSAGYHHYFDKQAKQAGAKEQYLSKGTNEYLLGVEVDLSSRLTLSAGGQITRYGQTDAFQSDLSFHLDSYSVGFGGAYKLSDKLTINAAYMVTDYADYTKNLRPYTATVPLAGKNVYKRTNNVFALGVDLSL